MTEENAFPEETGIPSHRDRLMSLHLATGLTYREIARRLGLTEGRVQDIAWRKERVGRLSGPSLVLLEQLEERAAKLAEERAAKPAPDASASIASISREADVSYPALYRRLAKGESLEQATRPVRTWERKETE